MWKGWGTSGAANMACLLKSFQSAAYGTCWLRGGDGGCGNTDRKKRGRWAVGGGLWAVGGVA